jgi:hypothetical protein
MQHPGFFQGASNIDVSTHGIFNDFGRDIVIYNNGYTSNPEAEVI